MRLYAQGATVTEVVEDEYGFAYRLDTTASQPSAPSPTFDPLTRIEQWPVQGLAIDSLRSCLDFVIDSWDNDYGSVSRTLSSTELSMVHAQKGEKFIRFATGGWSGNESLINALRRNQMIHGLAWVATVRGGLHIYRY